MAIFERDHEKASSALVEGDAWKKYDEDVGKIKATKTEMFDAFVNEYEKYGVVEEGAISISGLTAAIAAMTIALMF